MGRAWHFFLTVALVCGIMAYFYYTSDFYAQRAAGVGSAPAASPEVGVIPSNE